MELEQADCIRRYKVGHSTYLEVVNWLNHQKIDRPTKSRFPSSEASSTREASRGLATEASSTREASRALATEASSTREASRGLATEASSTREASVGEIWTLTLTKDLRKGS